MIIAYRERILRSETVVYCKYSTVHFPSIDIFSLDTTKVMTKVLTSNTVVRRIVPDPC